jgi:hypothetical protein
MVAIKMITRCTLCFEHDAYPSTFAYSLSMRVRHCKIASTQHHHSRQFEIQGCLRPASFQSATLQLPFREQLRQVLLNSMTVNSFSSNYAAHSLIFSLL